MQVSYAIMIAAVGVVADIEVGFTVFVPTQYCHNLVVLYHLQAAGNNEAETVDALAGVIEQIPRRRVGHHEVHR